MGLVAVNQYIYIYVLVVIHDVFGWFELIHAMMFALSLEALDSP